MIGAPLTQRRPLREPTVRIAPVDRRNPKAHAASVQAAIQSARRLQRGNRQAAAKKLPFAGNPVAVERRIQRFIASDRIDHSKSCMATAKWVIGSLPEDKPDVILGDETGLKYRLKAMMAAVAFAGRAIPVAWRRCPNEDWPMGLVNLITKMLGWVRDALGSDRKAIAMADMESATCPSCSGISWAWGCSI